MAIFTVKKTITEDESAGLQTSGIASATDDNNDNDVASLPSAIAGQLSAALSGDTITPPAPVTGFFPSYAEVDGFATVDSGGATLGNIFFSDGSGSLLNGSDSGLTTDSGNKILLYTSATDDNVVYGKDASTGALVFAIILNETQTGGVTTGANIGIVQYQPISNPTAGGPSIANFDDPVTLLNHLYVSITTETVISDFSAAPSGDSLWVGIKPSGGGNPDILVTGIKPNPAAPPSGDRVEVSTNGLGENSQAIDQFEGLRIDFVNDVVIPNSTTGDDPTKLSYSTHVTSHGAGWSAVQVNPTKATVNALMVAYDATGDQTGQGFFDNLTAQTQVAITSVKVFSTLHGTLIGTATNNGGTNETHSLGSGVSVKFNVTANLPSGAAAAGTAEVDGILGDYHVEFRTTNVMDRFTVNNVTPQKNRSFDLGDIANLEASRETDEVGSNVRFEDDGPTISGTITNAPTLTVDETNLGTDATGSFSGQFTKNFGADGAAASGSVTYALGTAGGNSGLTDTASGNPVFLFLETGKVIGREGTDATVAASGPIVFSVSVDSTGTVTLDQQRAIVQDNLPNTPDDSKSLSGTNLVQLTSNVKDGDGDTNSATLDITTLLTFKDDGPTISGTITNALKPTVDETNLAVDDTKAFAGQFTKSFGADGPAASGSDTYALGTAGGNSGLTDTASKNPVFLFLESGQVVGRAGADATAATSGPVVFVVSVDGSGNVTLDQQRAIVQDSLTNTPDDAISMTTANLVTLTETVTDGDGDTNSATLNIASLLVFKDDGPSVTLTGQQPATVTVDETTLGTSAQGAFAGQFSPTFGADGQGATPVSYTLGATNGTDSGLIDTASNNHVFLFLESGQVVGREGTTAALAASGPKVFTVSVDTSGNVTLTQQRAIVQDSLSNTPDDAIKMTTANLVTLTGTATDGDGDQASKTIDLTPDFVFKDDGPTITVGNITNGTYTAGGSSTWSEAPGADGFKSLNVTLNNYTIDSHSQVTVNTSLGTDTTTDANGKYVFNGSITDDFNGDGTSETVPFKLTFDPVGNTYKIDVTTPPTTVTTFDTSQGSLPSGGPQAVQSLPLTSGPEAGKNIVFFGAVATAPQSGVSGGDALANPPQTPNDLEDLVYPGATDLTKAQIDAFLGVSPPGPNKIPALINSSTQMNVSTSGIGINNNNLDGSGAGIQSTDESFVVNPPVPVDKVTVFIDSSVGGYDPSTEDLEYSVYFIDGSVTAPTKVQAGDLHDVTTGVAKGGKSFDISDVAGGPQIDAVQLTMANGTVKIPVIAFSIQQSFTPQTLDMNLTATLTDGDQDTSKQSFSIHLTA